MCTQMWKICSLVVIQDSPLCRAVGLWGSGNTVPAWLEGFFQVSVNSNSCPAAKGHFPVPEPSEAAQSRRREALPKPDWQQP